MSTLKPTRRISRRHELREDKVVTASSRVLDAARGNLNMVTMAAIAVIVLIVGFFGLRYYQGQQEAKAGELVAGAVRSYENGQYREALDGVAGSMGLTEVVDRYGSTPTGNLAKFYAADANYRLGEYEAAAQLFRSYDKKRDYIGASAYAGEAAILESQGEFEKAAALYEKAAEIFVSELTTPQYLFDAAVAYESAQEYSKARALLERVKEDYPASNAARDADLVIARVNAEASAS